MSKMPMLPGYYWAKWRIAAEGTVEGDELTPSDFWEIVQVNENDPNWERNPAEDMALSVSVSGVGETQWRDCFVWGDFVAPLKNETFPQPAPAVPVKDLEWREEPIPPAWECLASTGVGLYCIPLGRNLFALRFRDKDTLGEFDTLEAAKAAAQADYEARIRSALAPATQAVPDMVEAAQRIFEAMCGGPVDWAKHAADTNEDNLFQSADWECCLAYAKAALTTVSHPSLPAMEAETVKPAMFVSPEQFADRANFKSNYMPFRLQREGLFQMPLFTSPPKLRR